MLIGPPGSGKSTIASTFAPLLCAQVIANDTLREQLWGNAKVQGTLAVLEHFLHESLDSDLAPVDNVLMDATHAQLSWR